MDTLHKTKCIVKGNFTQSEIIFQIFWEGVDRGGIMAGKVGHEAKGGSYGKRV